MNEYMKWAVQLITVNKIFDESLKRVTGSSHLCSILKNKDANNVQQRMKMNPLSNFPKLLNDMNYLGIY